MRKIFVLLFISNFSFSQTLCWKQVATSNSYHCAGVLSDGTLWTWGLNIDGQLGDGTLVNKSVPTQVGSGTNWQSVSNNFSNSFGIKTNGTMWGWGDNSKGQLGIGSLVAKLVPTQIATATDWQSVSCGAEYTLAIKTNGTLWAWGDNIGGKLGDGTFVNKLAPLRIGLDSNWRKVVAAVNTSFGIKTDGTLWFWGIVLNGTTMENSTIPIQVGSDTWTDLSIIGSHVLGLKTNGTIWSWGKNDYGALGRGNNILNNANYVATQIGTSNNWKAISAGIDRSMAIKTDGTLWAWGLNNFGQYGNNTTTASFSPLQIGILTNWRSITLGIYFSTGFKVANDRLWTWGHDNHGNLGNGSTGDSLIPIGIGTCTTLLNENFDGSNNGFSIYPNPSSNFMQIDNQLNLEIDEIKIINILGKVILVQKSDFDKINLQQLDQGIYILSILSENNIIFKTKVVKN